MPAKFNRSQSIVACAGLLIVLTACGGGARLPDLGQTVLPGQRARSTPWMAAALRASLSRPGSPNGTLPPPSGAT